MTYKIGTTLSAGRALHYLEEYYGERFVRDSGVTYKRDESGNLVMWNKDHWSYCSPYLYQWVLCTFWVCEDPSKEKSEYEKEKEKFLNPENHRWYESLDLSKSLLDFLEKHFVRKEK